MHSCASQQRLMKIDDFTFYSCFYINSIFTRNRWGMPYVMPLLLIYTYIYTDRWREPLLLFQYEKDRIAIRRKASQCYTIVCRSEQV